MEMPTPRLSVAPMVGVTTRPHRYLCRLLSQSVTLYTEMVVSESIIYGKKELVDSFLEPCANGPVVLQIAGRSPERISQVVALAETRGGFSEINLNCGCPSKKAAVNGEFGAAMMKEPELVGNIIRSVKRVSDLPFTVKCRLGVDDCDSYEHVHNFINTIHDAGVNRVILHARKGLLCFDPKKNRNIPPLKYDWVYRLSNEFPNIKFDLNGGVNSLEESKERLLECSNLGGIMMGRSIWRDPLLLAKVDSLWYNQSTDKLAQTRREVLDQFIDRFENDETVPMHESIEAIQGLFLNINSASIFRKRISNHRKGTSLQEAIEDGISVLHAETLDENIRIVNHEEEDENQQQKITVQW